MVVDEDAFNTVKCSSVLHTECDQERNCRDVATHNKDVLHNICLVVRGKISSMSCTSRAAAKVMVISHEACKYL